MSYSIYKNKKLLKDLSDKDYRLLKFNKVLNPFHTYLMYSLVPSELNELNLKDLNSVVEKFKKNINKFVKKKFNKNYVNANAQKDLDIFAELCHLNISIFNNNFNNLHSSTKNKKYTKRLYLINRDNDLFLLIKQNKKGLKLKLGNNVLKPIQVGGGDNGTNELPIYGPVRRNSIHNRYNPTKNTRLASARPQHPPPMFRDDYYNPDKVNDFLITYCKKLIIKREQTDALTKFIDSIIYPQAQYIDYIENPQDKKTAYENFKIFKSFRIIQKKNTSRFWRLIYQTGSIIKRVKKKTVKNTKNTKNTKKSNGGF